MFSITVHCSFLLNHSFIMVVQIVMFQRLKDLKAVMDDVNSLKKHSEISEIESLFSSLESTHGVSLLVQQ